MKYAALTLLLCLSLFSGIAHINEPGSSRLISGKVIDKQTGEALSGVKVQVEGSDTFCYTDLNGKYVLPVNARSKTDISVNMVGYAPLKLASTETGLDQDLYLEPR